ncbi:MAG: aminopeptidase [Bacillota bacterium]
MGLMKGIKAMLLECMGLKPGETVLIIVDPSSLEIGMAMWEMADNHQGEAILIKMTERQDHAGEPPAAVAAAMRAADIILAPTTKSLSHTRARREACAAGARMASMPGITPGIITRSMAVDYSFMRSLSNELARRLSQAKKARLTSPLGTELEMSLEGRQGVADTGDLSRPGAFGNLPAGEAFIAPLEGSCRGVFYCDVSVGGFGRVDKALRCVVKDGFLTSLEGDKVASQLRDKLHEIGPLAGNIAELGMGTNPHTPLSGNPLEDEKVFGTVHIGIGNNKIIGGEVEVPFHVDLVIKKPTLYLDDLPVLREGKFV